MKDVDRQKMITCDAWHRSLPHSNRKIWQGLAVTSAAQVVQKNVMDKNSNQDRPDIRTLCPRHQDWQDGQKKSTVLNGATSPDHLQCGHVAG